MPLAFLGETFVCFIWVVFSLLTWGGVVTKNWAT